MFRVGAHAGNVEALDLDGAARCGHLGTVIFLLNFGAQANQKNMMKACGAGPKRILNNPPNPNSKHKPHKP